MPISTKETEMLHSDEIFKSADEIINYLVGTCNSFDPSEYSDEIVSEVDNHIFCCEECGWWCEMSEMSDDEEHDWTCSDCVD